MKSIDSENDSRWPCLSKRTVFKISCFFVAIALIGWLLQVRSQGPRYKGKRLSHWVTLSQSKDAQARQEAERAILAIGTNGVPYLLNWMRATESGAMGEIRRDFGFPESGGQKLAKAATRAFTILGTNSIGTIPELSAMLGSREFGARAAFSLGALGTNGFHALNAAFADLQQPYRPSMVGGIAYHFETIGTNLCVPFLVNALEDSDQHVRWYASNNLMRIDPAALAAFQSNRLSTISSPR